MDPNKSCHSHVFYILVFQQYTTQCSASSACHCRKWRTIRTVVSSVLTQSPILPLCGAEFKHVNSKGFVACQLPYSKHCPYLLCYLRSPAQHFCTKSCYIKGHQGQMSKASSMDSPVIYVHQILKFSAKSLFPSPTQSANLSSRFIIKRPRIRTF
jgi:hypothetical protein